MGIPAYIVVSRESQFDIYEVDYEKEVIPTLIISVSP
jgi:hypothetical protein